MQFCYPLCVCSQSFCRAVLTNFEISVAQQFSCRWELRTRHEGRAHAPYHLFWQGASIVFRLQNVLSWLLNISSAGHRDDTSDLGIWTRVLFTIALNWVDPSRPSDLQFVTQLVALITLIMVPHPVHLHWIETLHYVGEFQDVRAHRIVQAMLSV